MKQLLACCRYDGSDILTTLMSLIFIDNVRYQGLSSPSSPGHYSEISCI